MSQLAHSTMPKKININLFFRGSMGEKECRLEPDTELRFEVEGKKEVVEFIVS